MIKPPWGQISAVDLNKGEIVWQTPHGGTPDVVREHPALQHLDIPRTGWPGRIGTLVTKTLVIAGDSAVLTTASGERGAMLRAYAKDTGSELGQVYMPAPQTGSPMTFCAISSRAFSQPGVKRRWWLMTSLVPLAALASTIRFASPVLMAIGFSQMTPLTPA